MKNQEMKIGGIFTYEHIRDGEVIDTWQEHNIVTNQGLNYVLGAAMAGATTVTTWYVGLFRNNYTPTATDTAAVFPGSGVANEATTAVLTNSVRPTWTQAGASLQNVTNSASPAVFTFNASTNIYGAFLVSSNVLGGTTGTLAAGSQFASVRAMLTADVLNVTYSLSVASA